MLILFLVNDNNCSWINGRRRMTVEIISWSIPLKYGTRSGSNSPPLDLQSDLLPTALYLQRLSVENTSRQRVFGLVCCFTTHATAMVMSGRSVHLTTLFPGQAWTSSFVTSTSCTYFCLLWSTTLLEWISGREENDHRSIYLKVWDWAEIKLATPGSAVRHPSVARHVTDCAKRPRGKEFIYVFWPSQLILMAYSKYKALFKQPCEVASNLVAECMYGC